MPNDRAADPTMEERPWGSFRILDEGPDYKVKRITVRPGGKLSLQSHARRAEHWVVVRGVAQVTVGDEVRRLHPNQSAHIAVGDRHRLENPGKEDLELIEVQCGDYLGEDDIVRYDDIYNRR
jgi:mannose-6-phosphate isomerase-like protein (cupin superfamily)